MVATGTRSYMVQAGITVTAAHAISHAWAVAVVQGLLECWQVARTEGVVRLGAESPPGGDGFHEGSVWKT